MVEYIEREEMREVLEKASISTRFADIPKTANVRPERHECWIVGERNRAGFTQIECSDCGLAIMTSNDPCEWIGDENHQFCSRCGAKMDGKDGNQND